jgi:hypothetical protein
MEKDFLIVRPYAKGIAFDENAFYEKDGNSWGSDIYKLNAKNSMRIRLTINWQTIRFKRSVEGLDAQGKYVREESRFGKCEDVSPDKPASFQRRICNDSPFGN